MKAKNKLISRNKDNARKWKHQLGGSLYSSGNVVNTLYENASQVEKLGTPWHKYDLTLTEEWADAHGYFPDERGHRDDRVKKEAHPSHPSRGRWNKKGTKFYLSEKGMQDPNHTLFGLADGGLDPLATLYYKKGIVLPEITVTPDESYVQNTYDNIKLYSKHLQGGRLIPKHAKGSPVNTNPLPKRPINTNPVPKKENKKLENPGIRPAPSSITLPRGNTKGYSKMNPYKN